MSRTYKTRPYWVRLKDSHACAVAVHDHRFGDCDLVELDRWGEDPGVGGWGDPRCYWMSAPYVVTCGCWMCTEAPWRRRERRRSRHQARVACTTGRCFEGD
jgi:hypothetical protein